MEARYREEVINVVLAELLNERGIASLPEQIIRDIIRKKRRLPDVWVDYEGLTVAIEGKIENSLVIEDARRRVEQGLAHIAIAVDYPGVLRVARDLKELKREMASTPLKIAVVTEDGESGFVEGDLSFIDNLFRRTHEELVKEDVVTEAVNYIRQANAELAKHLTDRPAVLKRVASALEIQPAKPKKAGDSRRVEQATAGVAALVVFNAMVFQEILAERNERVTSLLEFGGSPDVQMALVDHWRFIIEEINYHPIYYVAGRVLRKIPASRNLERVLKSHAGVVRRIIQKRAALRHDLMGRVYHSLLEDAKYLGAFYTSVPAATLLLKLALAPERWPLDWADLEKVGALRVGDFACGTGTLLMAAAESIADNYVRYAPLRDVKPDLEKLHTVLIEDVIKGFDVLTSALHLTASSLAMRSAGTPVNNMGLYTLPLGGEMKALGSLDFIRSPVITTGQDLFGTGGTAIAVGPSNTEETAVKLPELHLCVMNPPFTRSVGGNLLFGSFPTEEREKLQKRLKQVLNKSKYNDYTNLTAGLGSPFIAVADKALKVGGKLALVLPKAFLSGVAWSKSRDLIKKGYELEYVIVSHDPGQWNFSENTSLSETLLVAKKVAGTGENPGRTVFVNLWKNPGTTFEALAVARSVATKKVPSVDEPYDRGALSIVVGDKKFGEAISVRWDNFKGDRHWLGPAAFAQSGLIRIIWGLRDSYFALPGERPVSLSLQPLSEFAVLGFDVRDMHDGFSLSLGATAYKAFWNHDSEKVTTLQQEPNAFLEPLSEPKPGRNLRDVSLLWGSACRLLIAERLRLNTQKLPAILVSEPVLSNVWWPLKLRHTKSGFQKGLVLWLNSSLGILILLYNREETEGAWVKFKKASLLRLPVFDFGTLPRKKLDRLASVFDSLSEEPFLSLADIADDPVRVKIDALFSEILGLPDLAPLREMLAREPVICLRSLSPT